MKDPNVRKEHDEDSSDGTAVINWEQQPTTYLLPKVKLIVVDGENKGKEFRIHSSSIQIGGRPENDLVLNDETVSRSHAEIQTHKSGYVIRDLGSTNGTFVNGVRVQEAFLTPGSIIQIGKTSIRFVPEDERIEIYPSTKDRYGELIGNNVAMRRIYSIIDRIAPTDVTIIIEGETGTGKELVARMIHQKSRRAKKPMVVFDCSAIAETLIESELFGHERGAFTGATGTRQGAFELANGGTIFLDEIGELSLELQPKLLRALESRTVKRVGADKHIPVDVRVICATHRNLESEVKKNNFREDLFYRLNVVPIYIPPLRKRRDDVEMLTNHFIAQYNKSSENAGKGVRGFQDEAMQTLKNYDWPGNIRELRNVVNRCLSFAESEWIGPSELPEKLKSSQASESVSVEGSLPFKEAKDKIISSFERQYLVDILKRNSMNISKAAKEAGIDRKSVQRLIKKYDIEAEDI